MKTDEELMQAYVAGDFTAFEDLYSRHKGKVYGYIRSKAGAERAEDIFQSAFARLHQKRGLYRDEYPFLPWFFTLVKNVIVDHFRKEKIRFEELGQEPIANAEENNEAFELEELGLDEDQFKLLYLKFVEGRGYKELEEEFSSSSAALRKKVSRVLQKLRGENGR